MIRLHKLMIVENEHLYGPGKRIVLFLKGCSIHCKGCINKHLWSFDGGTMVDAQTLIDLCLKEDAVGFTIHGGEPLDQAVELKSLVKLTKKYSKTIVLFTGYLKNELNKEQCYIWNNSDIVISGRYVESKQNFNLQFRGSTNQRVYCHKGPYKDYKIQDGYTAAIISIDENGQMQVNGFLTDDILKLTKF